MSVSGTASATDLGPLDPTVEHADVVSQGNANRYAYAGDDPINNLDLLGLYSARSCGIAGAALGVGTVALLLSVVSGPLTVGLGVVGYALAVGSVANACYD